MTEMAPHQTAWNGLEWTKCPVDKIFPLSTTKLFLETSTTTTQWHKESYRLPFISIYIQTQSCMTRGTQSQVRDSKLTLRGDQQLISPYIITPKAHIKVARIEEIITNYRRSSSTNKLSLLAPQEIFREQYGEITY